MNGQQPAIRAGDGYEKRKEHVAMNTWIHKMLAWPQRFATERFKQAPQIADRTYWDRQSRNWSSQRQLPYALQPVALDLDVRRRPR